MAVRLHAVADDFYSAVLAGGGEHVYGALEAVERPRLLAWHGNLKGFVVVVASLITASPRWYFSRTLVRDSGRIS